MCEKTKPNVNRMVPEWCAFGLFIVASIVMFIFHEPWYDEIQAWMVASDASVKDILFLLPHFEGHPPLWHLLLAVFAKNQVPMEIGLRVVSFAFSGTAAWVILFKSPFPRWAKLVIPFTYFLFCQYTIINRPYAILILGFVLSAWFYKDRNKKPIRYVMALYLMCLSCAYGMLFAACFCLIWTVEIVIELKGKGFWLKAVKDKRTWCLFGILGAALLLYLLIAPADNAFAQVRVIDFSKLKCLIYMFLVAPGDALITDIALSGRLQQCDNIIKADYSTIMCIVISVLLSTVIVLFVRAYRKIWLLVFPYTLFGLFGALVYFYNHHIGIIALFTLFVLWCCLADPPKQKKIPKFLLNMEKTTPKLGQKVCFFFLGLSILVSLIWSGIACKNDILYSSWYAKDLAEMIDTYDLDQYKVATQWTYTDKNGKFISEEDMMEMGKEYLKAEDCVQYVRMCNFVDVLAYSDKNYIYNFNDGDDHYRYVNHDMLSQQESIDYLYRLGEEGYPEIIIGSPQIVGMLGLNPTKYEYKPIYNFRCYRLNKYNAVYASEFVYARKDIYETRSDWPILNQIEEDLAVE